MSSAIGQSDALKQRFRFRVSIPDSNSSPEPAYSTRDARFTRVSGISGAVNVVEAPSGALGAPEKFPVGLQFADITLDAGAINNLALLEWFNEVALAATGNLSGGRYKRTIAISELDREDFAINRWVLVDAFPREYRQGPYDGNSNAFLITRLVLAYRSFYIQPLSTSRVPARPGANILDLFAVREDEQQSRFRPGQVDIV